MERINIINAAETKEAALAALETMDFVGIIFYDGIGYPHAVIGRNSNGNLIDCFGFLVKDFINGWSDEEGGEGDEWYNEFVIFDKELRNIIVSNEDALNCVDIHRADNLNFILFCERTVETSTNWDTKLGWEYTWQYMEVYYELTNNSRKFEALARVMNMALRGADKDKIKNTAEAIAEEYYIDFKLALVIIGIELTAQYNFFGLYSMNEEELVEQLVKWLNN